MLSQIKFNLPRSRRILFIGLLTLMLLFSTPATIAGPPTQTGEPDPATIEVQDQDEVTGEQATLPTITGDLLVDENAQKQPGTISAAELALLEKIEQALRAEAWAEVRQLTAELPQGQYEELVESILATIPRERPQLSPYDPVSAAEEADRAAAVAADTAAEREQAAANRILQAETADSDKLNTPAGSGAVPRGSGPIAPPVATTEDRGATPAAVLTVGAGCTYGNLQAAVDAATSGDTIWLHGTTWTGNSATANINSKTLYIYGGLNSDCSTSNGSETTLDATGTVDSVLEIYGTAGTVELYHMRLINGSNDANYGGGIEIDGGYIVRLFDTDVEDNTSTFGGGVHMSGANTLIINNASRVAGNSAFTDGGGIYCVGGGEINVIYGYIGSTTLGGNVADSNNDSDGDGGGAYLDDCTLYVGDSSGNSTSRLYYNEADNGGGVYAVNNSYVGVRHQNAQISSNEAVGSYGGGVYLSGGSDLWVDDGDLLYNTANAYGGGIYASGNGVTADMDTNSSCSYNTCAELSHNTASAYYGGAAYISGGAHLDLKGVYVEDNQSGSLGGAVYATSNTTYIDLDSVMMTDNVAGSDYTLRLFNMDVLATANNVTFAGNTHGTAELGIDDKTRFDGFALIIQDNSSDTLVDGAGSTTIDCSILSAAFPGSNNEVVDPIFLDPANGNYHISRNSPAVDHCNGSYFVDVDYESRPSDVIGQGARPLADDSLEMTRGENYNLINFDRFRFDPVREVAPALLDTLPRTSSGHGLYLVQLSDPTSEATMDLLESSGTPIQYYPHFSYLMWADESGLTRLQTAVAVRWSGPFAIDYRISGRLAQALATTEREERFHVQATLYDDGARAALADDALNDLLQDLMNDGATLVHTSPRHVMGENGQLVVWELWLTRAQIERLYAAPNLVNVDLAPDFDIEDESSAQIIANNAPGGDPMTGYNDFLDNLGYDGSGVLVAIADTGVDWDHPDLNVASGTEYGGYSETGEPGSDGAPDLNNNGRGSGHGTHVAGIVAGDGGSGDDDADGFLYGLGVAPGANLHAMDAIGEDSGTSAYQMTYDAASAGAAHSNNSWGAGTGAGYSSFAANMDDYALDAIDDNGSVRDLYLNVFSAGNSGDNCASPPCTTSITEPKEAKNLLVVGSTDSDRTFGTVDDVSDFSSRGPAADNRILPNVMAPGDSIVSTENRDVDTGGDINVSCDGSPIGTTQHAFCSGTSMAAPHVSGVVALFTEFWHIRYNTSSNPNPATVKAAIIATTDDLGGMDDGWGNTLGNRPDNHQGWGRVNIERLLDPPVPVQYYDNPDLLQSSSESWSIQVRPYDTNEPVRITLVWSDAPGAANANPALVNDLDLIVTDPNTTDWHGNRFGSDGWSTTGVSYDTRNNVENVWIENPTAGDYTILVDAWSITGDAYYFNGDSSDQHFSLVCYNCEEIVDGQYDAGADEAYAFVGVNGNICEYGTIGDAIAAANAGDIIYVPDGIYNERLGLVTKDLTIAQATDTCTNTANHSYNQVTIDANDSSATWGGVLDIDGSSTITLSHIYLRDGTATYGGVVYVTGGSTLVMDHVGLGYGSSTTSFGGALRSNGTVTMKNNSLIFSSNTTGSGLGAGVAIAGGTMRIYDTSSIGWPGFPNNAVTDGGGVYMSNGLLRLYNDSRIRLNSATANGGGIFATGSASIETYDSSYIGANGDGNSAVLGGGVYITGTATLEMYDSSDVRDNSASDNGGGIFAGGSSQVTLDGASAYIEANDAGNNGGGVYVEAPASFTMNQGFINLSTASLGGGLYAYGDGGTVTLNGGGIYSNDASWGGGIRMYDPDDIGSLIVLNGGSIYSNDATSNGGGLAIANGTLTMNAGNITGNDADSNGGGIYNTGGDLDLSSNNGDVSISDNRADANGDNVGNGGGIYENSPNTLNINGVNGNTFTIDNNSAENGGGIYVSGVSAYFSLYGDVDITNNTANMHGGGVYQSDGAGFIDDSGSARPLLDNNEATNGNGGGIYLLNVSATNYFNGMDINNNTAPAGDGGGLYSDGSSTNLRNVHMMNNEADIDGGAIFAGNGSALDIFADTLAPSRPAAPTAQTCDPTALAANAYCSLFSGNISGVTGSGGYGGALYLDGSSVTVEHTAFIGNDGDLGSVAYLIDASSSLLLSNSLLQGNLDIYPLRVLDAGTLTVNDTTIAGNPSTAVGINDAGATVTFNNSILWDNGGGVFTSGAISGSCNISQDDSLSGINADPLFVTTARGDYRLNAGSPAIDACNSGTTIGDLDNVERPKDGDVAASAAEFDMGSFEYVCVSGVPTTTAGISVSSGSDIMLSWTAGATNDLYKVYRETTPYFSHGPGNWIHDGLEDSTGWTDSGKAGDLITNYFYYVVAQNCDSSQPEQVEHMGEFDFALEPGS